MSGLTPTPPPDADGNTSRRGLLNSIAQAIQGVKNFLALIVASAGIQVASLFNTNGTGASDVGVKVGVSTADASVNATAKLFSVRTGIGGTEVEKFWALKDGSLRNTGRYYGSSNNNGWVFCDDSNGGGVQFGQNTYNVTSGAFTWTNFSVGGVILRLGADAAVSWRGVDRSATIGADTQNWPSGINTIASGTTSVVIANNLVPNPATAKVRLNLTWRGDPGSRWWWTQGTGTITVNLQSAAPANVSFDWELNGLN